MKNSTCVKLNCIYCLYRHPDYFKALHDFKYPWPEGSKAAAKKPNQLTFSVFYMNTAERVRRSKTSVKLCLSLQVLRATIFTQNLFISNDVGDNGRTEVHMGANHFHLNVSSTVFFTVLYACQRLILISSLENIIPEEIAINFLYIFVNCACKQPDFYAPWNLIACILLGANQ